MPASFGGPQLLSVGHSVLLERGNLGQNETIGSPSAPSSNHIRELFVHCHGDGFISHVFKTIPGIPQTEFLVDLLQ